MNWQLKCVVAAPPCQCATKKPGPTGPLAKLLPSLGQLQGLGLPPCLLNISAKLLETALGTACSLIYSGTILGSWGQRLVGGFLRLQTWLTIKYFFVLGSKIQGPRQSTFPSQCPSHIHLTSSKPTPGGVQSGLPCAVHLCVTLSTLLNL